MLLALFKTGLIPARPGGSRCDTPRANPTNRNLTIAEGRCDHVQQSAADPRGAGAGAGARHGRWDVHDLDQAVVCESQGRRARDGGRGRGHFGKGQARRDRSRCLRGHLHREPGRPRREPLSAGHHGPRAGRQAGRQVRRQDSGRRARQAYAPDSGCDFDDPVHQAVCPTSAPRRARPPCGRKF